MLAGSVAFRESKPWIKALQGGLFAIFLGLLTLLPCLGSAQLSADEPMSYRPVIKEAVAEYDAQNFAEARSLFSKALSIYPSARAYRGQGMSEFELRNYADSVTSLEQALAAPVQRLDGSLRSETEQLLTRARGFIASIDLTVTPLPATVLIDHVPWHSSPPGTLVLQVGDHTLQFRAAGYLEEVRALKVKGGEQLSLHVGLQPAGAPLLAREATAPVTPVDTDPNKPLYKNPWLWTGVGVVVVAAVVTGLAVGLKKDSSHDDMFGQAVHLRGP